jgi:hypothetical protein
LAHCPSNRVLLAWRTRDKHRLSRDFSSTRSYITRKDLSPRNSVSERRQGLLGQLAKRGADIHNPTIEGTRDVPKKPACGFCDICLCLVLTLTNSEWRLLLRRRSLGRSPNRLDVLAELSVRKCRLRVYLVNLATDLNFVSGHVTSPRRV